MKNLPLYRLEISTNDDENVEVNFVALVDEPAIEKNFIAFDSKKQYFVDREKRQLCGALMIPDLKIYRRDNEWGEYNVVLNADTIEQIMKKMARKGYQKNVNIMHDPNQTVGGVYMFQSWIINKSLGLSAPKGMEDLPEGTAMAVYQVDNPEVWEKIKGGEVQGFSVEGIFEHIKIAMDKKKSIVEEVENLISGL